MKEGRISRGEERGSHSFGIRVNWDLGREANTTSQRRGDSVDLRAIVGHHLKPSSLQEDGEPLNEGRRENWMNGVSGERSDEREKKSC
jgi:hypothetical protein